jgi:hypothetical protein
MRTRTLAVLSFLALASGACSGGGDDTVPPDLPVVAEARAKFPDALTLHTKVVARSCSPATGVCHNNKEYPDLHTAGNFVQAVTRPCNQDKADPSLIFDGCENVADTLDVGSVGFKTRIGWIGDYLYDQSTGISYRPMSLEKAAPESTYAADARFLRNGSLFVAVEQSIELTAGSKDAKLLYGYNASYETYQLLEQLQGGDPNGNGVYGAEDPWQELMPGHTDRSYLLGRITGTVPGSRMPLANQPLSDPEYVALFCWVESIGSHPGVEDKIDYGHCKFARNPVSYALP